MAYVCAIFHEDTIVEGPSMDGSLIKHMIIIINIFIFI